MIDAVTERLLREHGYWPQPGVPGIPLFRSARLLPALWCMQCKRAGRKVFRLEVMPCPDGCPGGTRCMGALACPVCDVPRPAP